MCHVLVEEKYGDFCVGKPYGEKPLGRFKGGFEGNIIINLNETRREGMDWIHLAHDRDKWRHVVGNVMNFLVP
jgi:hypothetical protein